LTTGHHDEPQPLGSEAARVTLTAELLSFHSRRNPELRELVGHLLFLNQRTQKLDFPPALQTLNLKVARPFAGEQLAGEQISDAIWDICGLSQLTTLILELPFIDGQLSFAPLALMPRLRHLKIVQPAGGVELSDAQVAELRALPQLQELYVQPMSNSLLCRLLAQPHDLQWQEIALPDPLDDEAAALLPQLPSLTAIKPHFSVASSNFDFLRRLPKLTCVHLNICASNAAPGRIESLVGGLQCCSQIEDLALISKELTAAHLDQLLPRLPRLQSLTLASGTFTTLAFLAQQPMTGQLTRFRLSSANSCRSASRATCSSCELSRNSV